MAVWQSSSSRLIENRPSRFSRMIADSSFRSARNSSVVKMPIRESILAWAMLARQSAATRR
jgi:hypothetical protein